jgi:urease accessory protein
MLVAEHVYNGDARSTERLVLPFELRAKSRLRTRLASGEEIGLFLPPGTLLRGGARLESNDGRIVEVVADQEPLLEARCEDQLLLARAAYHLGNRHVPLEVGIGRLAYQHDHVLDDMVRRLGLSLTFESARFEPEGGAYGHAHHGHAHHGHGDDHHHEDGDDHHHHHHAAPRPGGR